MAETAGRHAGKVAVCAGSATGLGAGVAARLAEEGARVVIGDVNIEAAEALAGQIRARGGEATAQRFDITDEASVDALVQGAAKAYGGLDLMHVNAADMRMLAHDKDALSIDLAVFDRTLEVALRGHLLCTRAAIPLMLERGRGAIVYTSSAASKLPARSRIAYGVAKASLNGLMRHVATRWGPQGVRANAVCPGFVQTEATRNIPDEMRAKMMRGIPSTRLGEVRDVAALVSFLLADEAEWINGQALNVDGGVVMHG
jgi:NAD(P)-dependent dehydrogenase (short-subunit alcohol dehydrogenase family)